jgi:hypothetical protein
MRSETDMTTQSPAARVGLTLDAALVTTLTLTVAHAADAETFPRVRSAHPTIASLLTEGQARSATFRRLVEAIDASDGIVYIEDGTCGHGVRACLLLSVAEPAASRERPWQRARGSATESA